MDSVYYQQNLKFLYEGSDQNSKPVYDVDPVLFSFAEVKDRTFFNTCVQPNLFIQNISGVTYETHVNSELFRHMFQKDTEAALNNVNRLKPLVTDNAVFSDSALDVEVNLVFQRSGTINGTKISNELNNVIPTQITDVVIVESQNRLMDIVKAVCKYVTVHQGFPSVYKINQDPSMVLSNVSFDGEPRTPGSRTSMSAIENAAMILSSAIRVELKNNLYDMLIATVIDLFEKETSTDELPWELFIFKNFNPSQNGFQAPAFYNLRTKLIRNFNIPESYFSRETTDAEIMYFKRILVDTFLKTSYPYIQLLLIDLLMKIYATTGDYINVRLGLLAKMMFVHNFITNLDSLSLGPVSQRIFTYINDLLTQLNNSNKIEEVLAELHQMSKKAVVSSHMLEQVKKDIAQNQINLGNISKNISSNKSTYRGKLVEFWLIFSLLLTLFLVSTVLIFLKMPTFVYLLIVIMLSIILIIQAINVIKIIISKN